MALKNIIIKDKKFNISYIIKNNNSSLWAVFLHGWGSNKELLQHTFSDFFKDYNHIYIDLPGFGNSSNDYILDSKSYCEVIQALLDSLQIKAHMAIGHSFGGKIATLLNPQILVLLSSAGIIKKRSAKVKLKIKLAKLCNLFGIKSNIFRTKDAKNLPQNMYECLKLAISEDLSEKFSEFNKEAYIFWGQNDSTTPIYMAQKIHSIIKDSKLHILEGDHFFFLKHAKTIDRIINE